EQRRAAEPAQVTPQPVPELDDLDIDVRVVQPECLHAQLPVLAVPAALRPLVAEQRREVPDLPRPVLLVLDVGTHDRSRPLGPERESAVPPVGELVHLLREDVRALAQPVEHLDVLEHWGDDELVTEPARTLDEDPNDVDPP